MSSKWFPVRDLTGFYSARRRWLGYCVGVVAPSAVFLLAWIVQSGTPRVPLYTFSTLAIIVSAMWGGLSAGLLALGLSLLYSVYFIIGFAHLVGQRSALLSLSAFVVVGVSVCFIVANLRRNISKREQAEYKARKRAAELHAIVDSMTERVYVCDSAGRPILTNLAFRKHYPAGEPPVYPQSFEDSVEIFDLHGRPLLLSERPISRVLRGEQVRGLELQVRFRHSGEECVYRYNGSPVLDSLGNVVMAVMTSEDVTEAKKAEQALIQTEKLASVGRLAATIAHEVNNPLAAATNAVYLASIDPSLSSQARDALHLADQELRRAAHITGQTLGFVRGTSSRCPIFLPRLIDEVLQVYARKLRDRGVTVHKRYKCGPCREECESCFTANGGELRQVIFNLLANGLDALQDNGTLHVRLCRISDFGSGPKLRLTIADNGCGIRAENLKRVFEPFFTTKESTGTGLGLWVSQQIVRKYEGTIRVRSQKEKGTVFCITVPALPLPPTSDRGNKYQPDLVTGPDSV